MNSGSSVAPMVEHGRTMEACDHIQRSERNGTKICTSATFLLTTLPLSRLSLENDGLFSNNECIHLANHFEIEVCAFCRPNTNICICVESN